MGKLTDKTLQSLIKAGIPGKTNDGGGLYFQISKAGSKSWLYRYKRDGKTRDMGLGPYPTVTLSAARLLASDQRKVLSIGADPLAARDAEREAKREAQRQLDARRITFEKVAADYREAHGQGWSEKWRKGWLRKLEMYVFPVIGKMPAGDIQTGHVLKVLQPIWAAKTRTAEEVRGQIEKVLDAAKVQRLRDGDNPARWRGHLESLLSKDDRKKARKYKHFTAMSWRDVPALMTNLAQVEERAAVAARLLIYTGARSQMIRLAEWSEFDLQVGVWSLPAERMKTRKAFDVPLAQEVVEMLAAMPRIEGSPYLFPGRGRSGVMHANAMRDQLHSMGHGNITRHGFRSSFRDWANERTHYPREVCELALAHDERSQTEAAYSRSDFIEKRRALMADWAAYCSAPPAANVIQGDFKRA
ncbi:MAG: tyrosine-type recombinase/integrase [Gammaproteobacteria bacterium]